MTQAVMIEPLAYNFNLNTTHFATEPDSAPPFDRYSFMHELAREGDLLSAEVLYNAGSEIDLPDDQGRRPLHEAAFFGHMEMVKFFLDQGAVLDAPVHPFGHTALYLAVQQSRYDIVRYLVKRGARLDIADQLQGAGLLHIAAAKNDIQMTGLLISSGIDVLQMDHLGQTARDIASRHGHTTLAKILLKVMEHHAKFGA